MFIARLFTYARPGTVVPALLRTVTSRAATYPTSLRWVHAFPTGTCGGLALLVESGVVKEISQTPACPAGTGIAIGGSRPRWAAGRPVLRERRDDAERGGREGRGAERVADPDAAPGDAARARAQQDRVAGGGVHLHDRAAARASSSR